ncbi:MAG TPA: cyclopropane-fatty-acyl-phospholipid synthase family protein [Rhizobiaceae bacterium]|nr:cyclopropane-fatty-acyl-phospholipid synthase family protein [Rhizobiaceae bacterium]
MFERKLAAFIKTGSLTIIRTNGRRIHLGETIDSSPQLTVVVRLTRRFVALKLMLRPDLYFGEAYMDGALVIEQGTLWDLFKLCGQNFVNQRLWRRPWFVRIFRTVARPFQQHNSLRAARRNVAHHYDLSELLFRAFLDDDMQYSCAYFRDPLLTLDEAQQAKKRHIIAKLLLEPGHRVLDIGCGWGGLAISIAQAEAVQTTAVTLSKKQLSVARSRAKDAEVDHRVTFEPKDYREISGSFDRIVSVGMFEHVGRPNYQAFFNKISALLTDEGVALMHSIGRMDGPGLTQAWTRKYIFPGGYIPALSEVLPAVERAGLWVTDIEILRLHYAETLRAWRERFLENLSLLQGAYDERFRRMWEFYLAGSEMAFRYDNLMVFQLQLAKRVDAVPLTRDYIFEHERVKDAAQTRAPA